MRLLRIDLGLRGQLVKTQSVDKARQIIAIVDDKEDVIRKGKRRDMEWRRQVPIECGTSVMMIPSIIEKGLETEVVEKHDIGSP